MAIKGNEVVYAAVGFLLVALLTPIGMNYLASTNSTFNATGTAGTWSTAYTLFSILLPIMYLIGIGLYFLPKLRSG